jgi:hypothetical protein
MNRLALIVRDASEDGDTRHLAAGSVGQIVKRRFDRQPDRLDCKFNKRTAFQHLSMRNGGATKLFPLFVAVEPVKVPAYGLPSLPAIHLDGPQAFNGSSDLPLRFALQCARSLQLEQLPEQTDC